MTDAPAGKPGDRYPILKTFPGLDLHGINAPGMNQLTADEVALASEYLRGAQPTARAKQGADVLAHIMDGLAMATGRGVRVTPAGVLVAAILLNIPVELNWGLVGIRKSDATRLGRLRDRARRGARS